MPKRVLEPVNAAIAKTRNKTLSFLVRFGNLKLEFSSRVSVCEKCPNMEFFLVRIFL